MPVTLLGALLMLVLSPTTLRAQHAVDGKGGLTDGELQEAIDGYRSDLVELRRRLGIPGLSVAIARGGELVWADGLGWANRETKREATANTPYRIASITKTMTAAVVVQLAHEGKLDLDAPVARVLPDGPTWADDVTVRQVLSHTSESDPPGTGFTYSGRDDLAPGYLPNGDPAPDGMLRSRTVGGNGVVSTAPDLARWASALASGGASSPLRRMPDDAVTRFHLAVSYARSGAGCSSRCGP